MYVSDTFQTPFVGIRSVCAVSLRQEHARLEIPPYSFMDRSISLHHDEWVDVGVKQSQSLPIVTCVCVSALAIVWKMKESSSNPQLPNPYTSFLKHCISCWSCIFPQQSSLKLFKSSSSSICEKFINFDKRNDTVKVTIRKPKQVHQWDHILSRNLKKHPSNDKTTAASRSSDRQQQQSSTARSQILAEIVFFPKFHFFFAESNHVHIFENHWFVVEPF